LGVFIFHRAIPGAVIFQDQYDVNLTALHSRTSLLIFPKIFPPAAENTAQSACMQKKLCSKTIFKAKREENSLQKSFLKQGQKWIHLKNHF